MLGHVYDAKDDYLKSMEYYLKALQKREEINDIKGIASSLNNIGTVYYGRGDYIKALEYYEEALKTNEIANDKYGIASVCNNLGMIYEDQSNDQKALEYYIKAQRIYSDLGNQKQNSKTLNHIGNILHNKGEYEKALDYYNQALEINQEIGNKQGIASVLNNIGIVYLKESQYNKSINTHKKALEIYRESNNKDGIAESLNNIGYIYQEMGNNSEAMKYFNEASEIHKETGNKIGLSITLYNLGTVYLEMHAYPKALEYFTESLQISEQIGFKKKISNNYGSISDTYAAQGRYRLAYEFHKKYLEIYNELYNEEASAKIAEMQTKYEIEKKNKEILLLKKDQELKNLELKRNQLFLYIVIGGTIILFIMILLVFSALRQKQKANNILKMHNAEISQHKEEIEAQRDEIEFQKNQISEKSKNITDSIIYAQRIQDVILPAQEIFSILFKETFLIYKPKDIVSGDFYWVDQKDENIFLAAVDCTGHGVPGAFMSIVGSNLLNQALNEHNITEPNDILNYISNSINSTFRKDDERSSVKVGMDLSVCKFNLQKKEMIFSGALSTMYLIRNSELIVYKGDYFPIGNAFNEDFPTYTSKKIELHENDTIYLFSDGYYDQFGGPHKKKFLSRNFKKALVNIQDLPLNRQKEKMLTTFYDWKSGFEQVDDVLVIGIKI